MDKRPRIVCAGCGTAVPEGTLYPFRCPNADAPGDVDHVLTPALDSSGLTFPTDTDDNPFVAYRELTWTWHDARRRGLSDEAFVALVRDLDRRVARTSGRGFRRTPFVPHANMNDELGLTTGSVWIKDETRNVAEAHKARHLMGLALYIESLNGLESDPPPELAIASCGNAALAAGVVAKACGRALTVFVPTWADAEVVERLQQLGARLEWCERVPGGPAGDPCAHRFRAAVKSGALPFSCQGTENGLVLEGGMTLGFEMVSELRRQEAPPLDRLFVQVGGGALASATIQALRLAHELGALERMPRIHAVQTAGGHPVERAWRNVVARIGGRPAFDDLAGLSVPQGLRPGLLVDEALRHAVTHRSEFMWPWEVEPQSIATGILDDETYDWAVIVRGMLETHGWPIVVDDARIDGATRWARTATGAAASPTGAAGLAGLVELSAAGDLAPDEHVAVLFTGAR